MSLSSLNCALRRGGRPGGDATFCSIFNPQMLPGSLSFAGSTAAIDSIGGQVASKLALEHFIGGLIEFFPPGKARSERDVELVTAENLQAIEAAFKNSNSSVYSFGHKLAAGGKLAAQLVGVLLQERVISVGRVGTASAYLSRGSELYPFFDTSPAEATESGGAGAFVGVASLVAVQLSSVVLEEGDRIMLFSDTLSDAQLGRVFRLVDDVAEGDTPGPEAIMEKLFPSRVDLDFAAVVQVGPDPMQDFLDTLSDMKRRGSRVRNQLAALEHREEEVSSLQARSQAENSELAKRLRRNLEARLDLMLSPPSFFERINAWISRNKRRT